METNEPEFESGPFTTEQAKNIHEILKQKSLADKFLFRKSLDEKYGFPLFWASLEVKNIDWNTIYSQLELDYPNARDVDSFILRVNQIPQIPCEGVVTEKNLFVSRNRIPMIGPGLLKMVLPSERKFEIDFSSGINQESILTNNIENYFDATLNGNTYHFSRTKSGVYEIIQYVSHGETLETSSLEESVEQTL